MPAAALARAGPTTCSRSRTWRRGSSALVGARGERPPAASPPSCWSTTGPRTCWRWRRSSRRCPAASSRPRRGRRRCGRCSQEDFATILLDVQMPGLDGFETAEYVRGRERTRDVPIIFVTAAGKERQHVFQGYAVGAVDYVFKPYDPEVLRAKVAVFLAPARRDAGLRAERGGPARRVRLGPDRHGPARRRRPRARGQPRPRRAAGARAARPGRADARRRSRRRRTPGRARPTAPRCWPGGAGPYDQELRLVSAAGEAIPLPGQLLGGARPRARGRGHRAGAGPPRAAAGRGRARGARPRAGGAAGGRARGRRACARCSASSDAALRRPDRRRGRARAPAARRRGRRRRRAPRSCCRATRRRRRCTASRAACARRCGRRPSRRRRAGPGRAALADGAAVVVDDVAREASGAPPAGRGRACAPGRPAARGRRGRRRALRRLALPADVRGRGRRACSRWPPTAPARRSSACGASRRSTRSPRGCSAACRPPSCRACRGSSPRPATGPAGRRTEVGGDWYDAVARPGGGLLLVIGDVAGRGVGAAAMMGQLRSAIRAYALLDASPAAVLTRLNAFHARHRHRHDGDGPARPPRSRRRRADYGQRRATRRALVTSPAAGPRWVTGGRGVPLGALDEPGYEEVTEPLEPGSTRRPLHRRARRAARRGPPQRPGPARGLGRSTAPAALEALADHVLERAGGTARLRRRLAAGGAHGLGRRRPRRPGDARRRGRAHGRPRAPCGAGSRRPGPTPRRSPR